MTRFTNFTKAMSYLEDLATVTIKFLILNNLIKQHKEMCYLTSEFSLKSKGIYGKI